MSGGNGEAIEGEVVEHGLARFQDVPESVRHVQEAAEKVSLQMKAQWAEESKERERWKAEDKREAFYAGLVGRLAAACIAEGAAGVRPTPAHVADLAANFADAVMAEIDKRRGEREARVAALIPKPVVAP